MGAVAAVFSKSPIDAPRLVAKMLRAMRHRAQDGAAVAWGNDFVSARSAVDVKASSPAEGTAVGHCFTKILPGDRQQPVRIDGGWLCLDGRVVEDGALASTSASARLFESHLVPNRFSSIPKEVEGTYSLCYSSDGALLVTRDLLGLKPLFIGRCDGLVAVASDRKALWAIGLVDVRVFPPGGCLDTRASEQLQVSAPAVLPLRGSSGHEVDSIHLSRLLVESMSVQTSGIGRCAAGFSGGVDSAVLAKIAAEAGIDLLLLTVGFGRTPEMSQAKSAAEAIGLPIVMREFTEEDLRECVDRVLWLIEEPNLMKVSVAVAVYWTAELAVEHGRSVIVLGQGSDELFGGYKRFATILGIEGSAAAREAISESVRNAHHVNFQRDEQATSSLRVELRLPFATRKIVNCASLIPLKMKVGSPTDDLRKWILRLAALDLGVPREIAMLRKRAIQHGSGIEKGIRDIAKKEHLTPSSYLESRFQSIKSQFEKR